MMGVFQLPKIDEFVSVSHLRRNQPPDVGSLMIDEIGETATVLHHDAF